MTLDMVSYVDTVYFYNYDLLVAQERLFPVIFIMKNEDTLQL